MFWLIGYGLRCLPVSQTRLLALQRYEPVPESGGIKMNNEPVAGVDVSKRFSDMCILAPNNSVFRRVKIYHDLTSMEYARSALQDTEAMFGAKPIIVMESTSHYHRLVWKFMSEAGYKVIVINPIQTGSLKNINVRNVKNDKVDAYKIATLYRLKYLRPSNIPLLLSSRR